MFTSDSFLAALVGGLLAVKFLILLAVGKGFRLDLSANFLFALALAQGGEFCFVLFSYHFAAISGQRMGMKIKGVDARKSIEFGPR